jgi:hydrogenase expression/formation protein HypD
MQNNDAFRSPAIVANLRKKITSLSTTPIKIMEFCGTHTHAIFRSGIRQLLPSTIELFSGPGCPVCVTDGQDIDYAIALSMEPAVIVATFGDLLRVPGSKGSLLLARAEGARVEVVYSPLDALALATRNPESRVVFLGIGFETTAPVVAASIVEAAQRRLDNYCVLSMHKLTPPAMRAILKAHEIDVGGILCPGHVSAVTGSDAWTFLSDEYGLPAAVAGFEPVDILWGIEEIVRQWEQKVPEVSNAYPRTVTREGNRNARQIMDRVFKAGPAKWRGLGAIPDSGLLIKEEYVTHDARRVLPMEIPESVLPNGCRCGEVIRGAMRPSDCPLFKTACSPAHPIGPCMVSTEGTCAAYYLYG